MSADRHALVTRRQAQPVERDGVVVVSSVASDSHTWNLVFLQLLIEELGYTVVNLGACVPDELLVSRCRELAPVLVVVSSVNGHGFGDGMRLIDRLRGCAELAATPTVIGGKLGISGDSVAGNVEALMDAGFDAVFEDGHDGVLDFRRFVSSISVAEPALLEQGGARG